MRRSLTMLVLLLHSLTIALQSQPTLSPGSLTSRLLRQPRYIHVFLTEPFCYLDTEKSVLVKCRLDKSSVFLLVKHINILKFFTNNYQYKILLKLVFYLFTFFLFKIDSVFQLKDCCQNHILIIEYQNLFQQLLKTFA